MNKRWATVLTCALLLGGCAVNGETLLRSGDRYASSVDFIESYKIGPTDKVRIVVFNEPQLSGDFQVSPEGALPLPLIGDLPVEGKTTHEVALEAQRLYAEGFVRNPRVSVEIQTYRPFFIVGEVRAPGQYPYVAGLTAWNAIATAQGLTPRGRKKFIYIRRHGEKGELPYALTPDLRVWPGDTIRVPERYF